MVTVQISAKSKNIDNTYIHNLDNAEDALHKTFTYSTAENNLKKSL
jgi:hypothetical protein